MAPGVRCITLESVPEGNRINPPPATGFALTMLATTASRDAQSVARPHFHPEQVKRRDSAGIASAHSLACSDFRQMLANHSLLRCRLPFS
jgi:hypothetical protein